MPTELAKTLERFAGGAVELGIVAALVVGTPIVTVLLPELSTNRVREFSDRADSWLRQNAPASFHQRPTGPTTMFAYIAQRNIDSMITGNVIGDYLAVP